MTFFLFKWVFLEFIFTEMFIELSSTSYMAFCQITELNWLPG